MRRRLRRPQWLHRQFWSLKLNKRDKIRSGGPYSEPNSDAAHEAKASADLQDTFGDPPLVQDVNEFAQGAGGAAIRSGSRNAGHGDRGAELLSKQVHDLVEKVDVNRKQSTMPDSVEVYGASSLSPLSPGPIDRSNARRSGQNSTSHQSRSGLRLDGTETSAVSEMTDEPYTIVHDGGQDLQSKLDRAIVTAWEAHANCGSDKGVIKDDKIEPRDQPEPDVLKITKNKLWNERIASASHSNKWFIPRSSLTEILTIEIISSILRRFTLETLDDQERLQLAKKIVGAPTASEEESPPKSYRAILALLIQLQMHEQIKEFVDHGIDDSKLPLGEDDWRKFNQDRYMLDWADQDKGYFLQFQWEYIPAYFGKKSKKTPHYELFSGHVLPYVYMNERVKEKAEEERKGHLRGSFGKVSIYHLHEKQQGLHRYTVEGQNGLIAVKKLISDDRTAFLEEHKVLMRLTPMPTPHLAKLLATYEQPPGRDETNAEFFLMFECADSNLKRFWEKWAPEKLMKEYGLSSVNIARWVATQCQGLAQGLETLHSHTEDKVARPNEETQKIGEPLHGLHGDIRPANMLRYTNWKDPQNPSHPLYYPLGVIQITDFGLSSYHHTLTAQDIRDVKILMGGSPYKAPESHLSYPVSQSLDIWAIGCVFIEFVTWLIRGDKGVRDFDKKRGKKNKDIILDSNVYFFEVRERDGTTQVSKSRAVIEWAEDLCKTNGCSQFIRDFVEFILARMLVIEDKVHPKTEVGRMEDHSRISAKDLANELEALVTEDDEYYKPSKAEAPNLRRYNRPQHTIIIPNSIAEVRAETIKRRRYGTPENTA